MCYTICNRNFIISHTCKINISFFCVIYLIFPARQQNSGMYSREVVVQYKQKEELLLYIGKYMDCISESVKSKCILTLILRYGL